MPADLPRIYEEIATGLLSDLKRDVSIPAAFLALEKESNEKDSSLIGYKAWKKSYDLLCAKMGIVFSPVKGYPKEDTLTAHKISEISNDQLIGLVDFLDTKKTGGIKAVQNSVAGLFLRDFDRRFSPLFLQIVQDRLAHEVAEKFTKIWRACVADLTRLASTSAFSSYHGFVSEISGLAMDPHFAYSMQTGQVGAAGYEMDPDKLLEAISGKSGTESQKAIEQFGSKMSEIADRCSGQNKVHFNGIFATFRQDIKQKLEQCKLVTEMLESMRTHWRGA